MTTKIEWVRDIVEAADKAGVPVFLKDNLKPLFASEALKQVKLPNFMIPEWAGKTSGAYRHLRQEFPQAVKG